MARTKRQQMKNMRGKALVDEATKEKKTDSSSLSEGKEGKAKVQSFLQTMLPRVVPTSGSVGNTSPEQSQRPVRIGRGKKPDVPSSSSSFFQPSSGSPSHSLSSSGSGVESSDSDGGGAAAVVASSSSSSASSSSSLSPDSPSVRDTSSNGSLLVSNEPNSIRKRPRPVALLQTGEVSNTSIKAKRKAEAPLSPLSSPSSPSPSRLSPIASSPIWEESRKRIKKRTNRRGKPFLRSPPLSPNSTAGKRKGGRHENNGAMYVEDEKGEERENEEEVGDGVEKDKSGGETSDSAAPLRTIDDLIAEAAEGVARDKREGKSGRF